MQDSAGKNPEEPRSAALTLGRSGTALRGEPFGQDLVGAGTWFSQAVWAGMLLSVLAVLSTAAALEPAAEGLGTHTQLGLPPCGVWLLTGYPCPGCGLTTAFAHMVRLEVVGAFAANPFGVVLFVSMVALFPVGVIGLSRKMPVLEVLDRLHAEKIGLALTVLSLSAWLLKLGLLR